MLSNSDDQFVMREDGVLPMLLIAPDALEAFRQPVWKGKIDGLIEIQLPDAVISARS